MVERELGLLLYYFYTHTTVVYFSLPKFRAEILTISSSVMKAIFRSGRGASLAGLGVPADYRAWGAS